MRIVMHYLVAMAILTLVGGEICPFVDGLRKSYWAVFFVLTFSFALVIRMLIFRKLIPSSLPEYRTHRTFILDLCVFAAVSVFILIYNFVSLDFPVSSGLKIMMAIMSLAIFTAIDTALEQERLVVTEAAETGARTVLPRRFFPVTMKLFISVSAIAILVFGVMFLIVARDIHGINSEPGMDYARIVRTELVEIALLYVFVMAEIFNLFHSYGKNLRLLFDFLNRALMAAADGSFTTRVPVGTNDEFGRMAHYANLTMDVLERRTSEKAAAEKATLLKDQFVSLVAHDLRSPFNSILGFLKLVVDDTRTPLDPKHKTLIARAMDGGATLVETVDKLLDITRLKTGKLKPQSRFANAFDITRQSILALEFLIEKKGIAISNELPHTMRIYADPVLAGEVIGNLLSNAIKFCRAGDKIRIFTTGVNPGAISVMDTGVGIPANILPNLFAHEVRTTTHGTAGEKGTGLGLPFCRDIMLAHGGDLTVSSEPGQGATFTALFPFATPKALLFIANGKTAANAGAIMKSAGIDVTSTTNLAEAENIIDSLKPDLALLDFDQSRGEGLKLAEFVKNSATSPKTLVLGIALKEDIELRKKGFELNLSALIIAEKLGAELPRRIHALIG